MVAILSWPQGVKDESASTAKIICILRTQCSVLQNMGEKKIEKI